MNTIFIVSPDYLEAIFEESKKYSFDIQGYGNFDYATKRVIYVNAMDVLGFVFAGNELPLAGSAECERMLDFFRQIDLMHADKKVLLVLKVPPRDTTIFKRFKHLRFSLNVIEDMVTDVVINKMIFGSILLDNFDSYKLKKEETKDLSGIVSTPLKLEPVVEKVFWEIQAPVHVVESLERSLEFDKIYQKYQNSWPGLFRQYLIAKKLGVDLTRLNKSIESALTNLDGKTFGIAYTLFSEMKQ